jgi:exonuclease SbcD
MPYSFSQISDIHLGAYQGKTETGGLNSRFLDFVKTYNESIDKTIKADVGFCLMPGDIFRSKTPTPEELNEFGKGVLKLLAADIPCVIVLGNHDLFLADNRSHSIGIIETLLGSSKKFYISKKPEIIKLETKAGIVQIQTMPYPIRSVLKLENTKLVAEYVKEKTNELYEQADRDLPLIYCGHYTIMGCEVGGETKYVDKFAEAVIDSSLFDGKKYDFVAMGHIHKFQEIRKDPFVVYAGSNNRCDFNEAKEDKGFVMVKVENGKTEYEFIKVNARKFIDLKYDLEKEKDPTQYILDDIELRKDDITDSIARLSAIISGDNELNYDVKKISDALENHSYWVHGTCLPTVIKKGSIRQDAGFSESMDAFQSLQHYAKLHKVKNAELFIKFGEKIIKQTNVEEKI